MPRDASFAFFGLLLGLLGASYDELPTTSLLTLVIGGLLAITAWLALSVRAWGRAWHQATEMHQANLWTVEENTRRMWQAAYERQHAYTMRAWHEALSAVPAPFREEVQSAWVSVWKEAEQDLNRQRPEEG